MTCILGPKLGIARLRGLPLLLFRRDTGISRKSAQIGFSVGVLRVSLVFGDSCSLPRFWCWGTGIFPPGQTCSGEGSLPMSFQPSRLSAVSRRASCDRSRLLGAGVKGQPVGEDYLTDPSLSRVFLFFLSHARRGPRPRLVASTVYLLANSRGRSS